MGDTAMNMPWTILTGHQYGMSPELETQWARAFLIFGLLAGFLLGVSL
jgi:hypothetical protein